VSVVTWPCVELLFSDSLRGQRMYSHHFVQTASSAGLMLPGSGAGLSPPSRYVELCSQVCSPMQQFFFSFLLVELDIHEQGKICSVVLYVQNVWGNDIEG
jgi:hypothetical protein